MENLRELNLISMILRMVLAAIAGGFLGLEREKSGHPAGLRTYMTVCLGAATTMILSQYLALMLSTRWLEASVLVGVKTDVSRFGAQVINGIGFLGAGTILITRRHEIKGLTTAASLWASACLGIAIGAGFYECALIAIILMFLSLTVFSKIETHFLLRARNMVLYIELNDINSLSSIVEKLKSGDVKLQNIDIDWPDGQKYPGAQLKVTLPLGMAHTDLVASLAHLNQVISVQEI